MNVSDARIAAELLVPCRESLLQEDNGMAWQM